MSKPELKFCENCQFVQEEYETYRKNLKLVDKLTETTTKKKSSNATRMPSDGKIISMLAKRILDQDRSSQLKFDFDYFKEIKYWAEKHHGV